jgi:hypothetical protein
MEQDRLDKRIEELSAKAKAEKEAEANVPEEKKEEKKVVDLPKKIDPHKVITSCPNCGKKQRGDDDMGIIATRYNVFVGPNKDPVPSLLKIACPFCGIESFRGKDLEILRSKAVEMKQMLLTPQGPIRSN